MFRWLPPSCQRRPFHKHYCWDFQSSLENLYMFLGDYTKAFCQSCVPTLAQKLNKTLNFHFKNFVGLIFFSINYKIFRTSQTQLCFIIFPPSLYYFYMNSYHVACLAQNGQSPQTQEVCEWQPCEEQRHKERTNYMNPMLTVQDLTGFNYFFYTLLNHEGTVSSQLLQYCSQNSIFVCGFCAFFIKRKQNWIPGIHSK